MKLCLLVGVRSLLLFLQSKHKKGLGFTPLKPHGMYIYMYVCMYMFRFMIMYTLCFMMGVRDIPKMEG